MRHYILAVALLLLPGYSLAQQPERAPGRDMRGGVAGAMLAQREALQLTADQVAKLEAIQKQQQEQFAAMRARLEQHRPEGAQLTPEERAARRAQVQQMTREQRAALRAELRERRAQMTPEQRQAMRAEVTAAREEFRASAEAARAVLTEEQQAKWQELVEARQDQRMREQPRRGRRGGNRPLRGRGMRTPPVLR
jgi:acyl-CoA reductase-like NAD-dependent aldehyde dehydrogenase